MKTELHAIGLDLGGTSIKYGICSEGGEIVKEFQRSTRADQRNEVIIADLAAAAEEALEFGQSRDLSVTAIGMGTPGCVNVSEGHIMGNTPNFKYWEEVPVKSLLEERLKVPVFVDNDANLMAFGESRYGAGKGKSNLVCLTLGTGIGGGIVIDDELFRGSHFCGSEIGHMTIHFDGIPCNCGGIGCWEKYASASAMLDHYRRLKPASAINSTVQIFKEYDQNSAVAVQVVTEEIRMVAVGIANLVNIFNPELVIIGGGVSEAGEWFIRKIAAKVEELAIRPALQGLQIVSAKLGNKAGLLGAAAFALQQHARQS